VKVNVVIKVMELSDVPSASEELLLAFKEKPWEESWTFSDARRRITGILESPSSFGLVALADNKVVGIALGLSKGYLDKQDFWLDEFSVDPNYQKQGIATKLMKELKKKLKEKEITKIYLVTRKHYPCVSLYEKEGFSSEGEDLLMTVDL
jgi:ribosomal protein S18 acetylase RimI-like enzyme